MGGAAEERKKDGSYKELTLCKGVLKDKRPVQEADVKFNHWRCVLN
jgi:hypothetical protein